MLKRSRIILIITCLILTVPSFAQFDDPKTFEIGPHVGGSFYMGDINPTKFFFQPQLAYGGLLRFNYNPRWTYRLDYTHAVVTASDEASGWRPERGLSFLTKINDVSLIVEFNFLEYYTGDVKRNISPYLFGGISVFLFQPYGEVDGKLVDLRSLSTEGTAYPVLDIGKYHWELPVPLSFSIPFGFGVKWGVTKHLGVAAEVKMHKTFTDYLDDCGTVYPEQNVTYTPEGGTPTDMTDPTGNYQPFMQRGNSIFDDWYGMANLSVTWKFNMPRKTRCNLSNF